MSDEAEAVTEVAKTGGKAIDALREAGPFIRQVFGDLLVDGFGLVSDRLKAYRIERVFDIRDRVNANFKKKGITQTVAVSPGLGMKLLEEAVVADTDDIRVRWANLLTNAMDPAFNGTIKRSFVSILADLEAVDVKTFDHVIRMSLANRESLRQDYDSVPVRMEYLTDEMQLDWNVIDVSLRNLMRLGLIKPHVEMTGLEGGQIPVTYYWDTLKVSITGLGLEFYAAMN